MKNQEKITLTRNSMDLIDDYIGTLGTSRSNVIEYIIIDYFKKETQEIKELKLNAEKYNKIRYVNKKAEVIEKKIEKFFELTRITSITNFIDYLNITREIFWKYYTDWGSKFDFKVENENIIKLDS